MIEGIIEPASGPTSWILEMVIVEKDDQPGEIRIVTDAREANKAIQRERHNTPTIDDLAILLNKAKYCSKLDLKKGFEHIRIAEKSRYITTFRTPRGLMRNKRLTMGICCASEMFQHELEKKLDGLIGVKSLVDDIFIWGETQEAHDNNLMKCLKRRRV